ncbi:ABC transporter permease [Dyella nitratireducens]|uniref:ABC transporter ATP-binding protein n=1 Tax=Dyella nitratireducens TaxID=1849580 RepID=A0ABQ1FMG6_9GAMM|nr:FtsX-like permease family protein [Dyella nitratireducens]GGA22604.1 ABC transporter ATP-binding protein [Dyella nitratireducens]GLQ44088.1 ABC transporter ATP-binding protein [Dyella nitratireducens]
MFGYYLDLAVRSLKHNKVLTLLMVLTLALGIGASITTLTVATLLSGNPLPGKSGRLFHPQIDPFPQDGYVSGQTQPPFTLTYRDAMNLLQLHRADRQALVSAATVGVTKSDGVEPIWGNGVLTTADFFPMFDSPFQFGAGWNVGDDAAHQRVVVIAGYINDQLFGGADSVGRSVRIHGHDFRIVGVLKHWAPQPRFYGAELDGHTFGDGDAVFMPLEAALDAGIGGMPGQCFGTGDQRDPRAMPCTWLGFWVELDSAEAVAHYRNLLDGYVRDQIKQGQFYRSDTALPDLTQLMHREELVPHSVKLKAGLAFGFLLVCVVNTVGLLLAKCLRRSQEIGVRRALGATRGHIFAQFMMEAALIGVAGGVLGLLFAELGLWGTRHQPAEYASLARLDPKMFLLTFVVALAASLLAGLLPSWRASGVAPASQIKAG